MALISCSECGKEVSDKAKSCPGCGAPIGKQADSQKVTRKGAKWEAVGFLLIASSVVAFVVAAQSQNSNAATFAAFSFLIGLVIFIIGRFK